ncbi:MAG: hypothetical protein ACXWLL_05520, partial [Myxococcaceae bacterium]
SRGLIAVKIDRQAPNGAGRASTCRFGLSHRLRSCLRPPLRVESHLPNAYAKGSPRKTPSVLLSTKSMRSIAGGVGTLKLREHVSRSLQLTPLALATLVSLANSVLLAIVYARVGGSHAYGIFQMALATTGVVAVIAMSGAGTAATRAAAQGRRAAWALFKSRLPWCAPAHLVLDVDRDEIAGAAARGTRGRGGSREVVGHGGLPLT